MKLTFRELSQISSFNQVIRFQEDFPQARFPNWVILQVEFVEPMEGILVGVHIQRIDRKVVGGKLERFKHLRKSKMFLVTEDNDILSRLVRLSSPHSQRRTNVRTALHLRFDKAQQMLLVHATGMVYVGVDFAKIVEVSAKGFNVSLSSIQRLH